MKTRLNKYLADRGICSRREADRLIEAGKVMVNGSKGLLGMQVDDEDAIAINGALVETAKPTPVFIALHKPVGIITSSDPTLRDNVIEFLDVEERVFPIGRLDVGSSGLLLLTNDGRLAEQITHPRYHHEKEYVVGVDRPIQQADLNKMASGMIILGSKTKRATVTPIDATTFRIVLTEGRNRQIRRMCEALGYEVKKLKRVRVMNIELGSLAVGKWRHLTKKEIDVLQSNLREPSALKL